MGRLGTFQQARRQSRGGAGAESGGARFVRWDGRTLEDPWVCEIDGADAVITPADDGGYVLLGLRRPSAGLFRRIPWGESGVLAATRSAAAREGLRLVETASWYDIDRIQDLARLREELQTREGGLRAPHTRRALDAGWTPEIGSC